MGIGVSHWRLARAVSARGQLGVVSGVGVDALFVRRLEDGDPGGDLRRALSHFPIPGAGDQVLRRYFRQGGRPPGTPYRDLPMFDHRVSAERERVAILSTFVEVWLAKEGHSAAVGLNLLTKVQPPTLPSLYGAILAGVDVVLMGAGIPREIPLALDHLAAHQPATLRLEVTGSTADQVELLRFDPRRHWEGTPALRRPRFLAIVSSNSLATMLTRKATGRVDGFVVEGPTAGGHNAPPRGPPRFNDRGEPIYGQRDEVDLPALARLGLPFWIAGGAGSPAALSAAVAAGAAGVQVGTLFAFCQESGLDPSLRQPALAGAKAGTVDVFTDSRASPTGYPFKRVVLEGLPTVTAERTRVCDLGYLRTAYRKPDGKIGYRCPGEPVDTYLAKGGALEDTVGRQCLCNALLANVGHGQVREDGTVEAPLLTSGDDLKSLRHFLGNRDDYSVADVLRFLLQEAAGRLPVLPNAPQEVSTTPA
ncbi:MAG: nitronate monooxygenase [Myxococcota bacterium]|nr:nitronate monooxygenase [Myxococcota bacterium]